MNHQEKVDRFVEDLTSRGAWKSNIAPPLWQLLWRLGVKTPPPLFLSFPKTLLIMGPVVGLLWGVIMWHLQYRDAGRTVLYAAILSAVFALVFSVVYAGIMGWMRKKYGLTTWEEYGAE